MRTSVSSGRRPAATTPHHSPTLSKQFTVKKNTPFWRAHPGDWTCPHTTTDWPERPVSRVLFLLPVTRRQVMTIHLGPPLPTASSDQPGSTGGQPLTLPYSVLLLMGFTWHPASPSDPVSSYLTLSPLPALAEAWTGGLLSVALSLGSPPLDVIQHHALWSPDFPPPLQAAVICAAPAKPFSNLCAYSPCRSTRTRWQCGQV